MLTRSQEARSCSLLSSPAPAGDERSSPWCIGYRRVWWCAGGRVVLATTVVLPSTEVLRTTRGTVLHVTCILLLLLVVSLLRIIVVADRLFSSWFIMLHYILNCLALKCKFYKALHPPWHLQKRDRCGHSAHPPVSSGWTPHQSPDDESKRLACRMDT